MKFRGLPVGATFRFFRRGLLLTKTGDRTYASEQAGMHQAVDPDSEVLPEDCPARAVDIIAKLAAIAAPKLERVEHTTKASVGTVPGPNSEEWARVCGPSTFGRPRHRIHPCR